MVKLRKEPFPITFNFIEKSTYCMRNVIAIFLILPYDLYCFHFVGVFCSCFSHFLYVMKINRKEQSELPLCLSYITTRKKSEIPITYGRIC